MDYYNKGHAHRKPGNRRIQAKTSNNQESDLKKCQIHYQVAVEKKE